jgi:hypothetical protein
MIYTAIESLRDGGMGGLTIILPYIPVSLICGHFGLTEDSASGLLHRIIGSVQVIVRNKGMWAIQDWPVRINGVIRMDALAQMPS